MPDMKDAIDGEKRVGEKVVKGGVNFEEYVGRIPKV